MSAGSGIIVMMPCSRSARAKINESRLIGLHGLDLWTSVVLTPIATPRREAGKYADARFSNPTTAARRPAPLDGLRDGRRVVSNRSIWCSENPPGLERTGAMELRQLGERGRAVQESLEAVEKVGRGALRRRLTVFARVRSIADPALPGYSFRRCSSGRTQDGSWLPASEELHQAFEVLGRGRQVELLHHIPEAPQPDPFHPEPLREFGEQRLDPDSGRGASAHRPGCRRGADRLARRFLPVHKQSPRRACRTALLLWILPTLRFGRAVDVALLGPAHAAIAQRLARAGQ